MIGASSKVDIFGDRLISNGDRIGEGDMGNLSGLVVKNLMIEERRVWDSSNIRDFWGEEWENRILATKILSTPRENVMVWTASPSGVFGVKSMLLQIQGVPLVPVDDIWSKIWKLKIHEKVKLFLWRIASNCFMMGPLLVHCNISVDPNCRSSGNAPETLTHCSLNAI